MVKPLIYCLVGSWIIFGCSSTTTPTSSDMERYKEDLSVLRPEYENPEALKDTISAGEEEDYSSITPKYHVTRELNAILDSIDVLKKDVRYIDGFTIQVYSGTNSEQARITRGKIFSLIPEADPVLKFDEPNFKVKVGKFYSRIEAQKTYAKLKGEFPKAIIIPERIYIQ
ncbi:hypothetical protein C900_04443 [Fulvivirga imtechensis AK7]|uniref:SPOR domain-containing protein n=1 Tax=Fulvivirga imtechensis AK7 TaxID=1237149 RepID=L8JM82_9BACT|nr:SPOR domain-containing protein [Fulvivirga imtechensis]ELR69920.1 hypothetical protein C900_04443 [Fulvivirga imtechensis AK7]